MPVIANKFLKKYIEPPLDYSNQKMIMQLMAVFRWNWRYDFRIRMRKTKRFYIYQ